MKTSKMRLSGVLALALFFTLPACAPTASPGEKGPVPRLTESSRRHIEERHVQSRSFPEKSKFAAGTDFAALIPRVYEEAETVSYERARWIYDWESDRPVGREGQSYCRLVTEGDGEVVTFYPYFKKRRLS